LLFGRNQQAQVITFGTGWAVHRSAEHRSASFCCQSTGGGAGGAMLRAPLVAAAMLRVPVVAHDLNLRGAMLRAPIRAAVKFSARPDVEVNAK
jgi:hypothetical protein